MALNWTGDSKSHYEKSAGPRIAIIKKVFAENYYGTHCIKNFALYVYDYYKTPDSALIAFITGIPSLLEAFHQAERYLSGDLVNLAAADPHSRSHVFIGPRENNTAKG